ncbi:Intermembrane phospholipid transport system lipoprotein MlaA [Sinobacterium norvegicum]|uniref:Intermembrane phospholipid transport system lipoprotein MlaA n=1 Tax=Sinobacterium norvegicum TaxID=1641715 RepID=A0ABM9ABE4_9GAMM|nr:VacJ family lipoprotein [Sinobacterium norvegicum]CAH0990520.1 Intermembrane phospholipid transport system lipoprotein MlaA [Sinobacterium norvegicum]
MIAIPKKLLLLWLLLSTLTTVHANSAIDANPADPWEGMNRAIFTFNDIGDRYFLRPIASGYHFLLPDPVERGVSNMFSNTYEVVTIVNDLLQLKFVELGHDSSRLVINTTIGIVGVFDVASRLGFQRRQEDFGQTMAYYGMPSGPYLVLPFWGSTTVRDGIGLIPDAYAAPIIGSINHVPTRNVVYATNIVSRRAGVLDVEKLISGDRYSFIRDAYLQRREWLINDGQVVDNFGEEDFDDFDDDFDILEEDS